jgi:hypothetical protein
MPTLVERYADRIHGVLSCYDRVIVRGGIRGFDYAQAMESYLRWRKIPLFDFPKFAKPYRDAIRDNAERLARENGIEVQFIRHHQVRKEDIVARILEKRGDGPGLVAILSALETCESYEARYDKKTGRTSLRPSLEKAPWLEPRPTPPVSPALREDASRVRRGARPRGGRGRARGARGSAGTPLRRRPRGDAATAEDSRHRTAADRPRVCPRDARSRRPLEHRSS